MALLVASPVAAQRFQVSFESVNAASITDPDGVLPEGWDPVVGFGEDIWHFTGAWIYESSAIDQLPEPHRGLFLFDDPDLTISLNAAGLILEYQLESIEFSYVFEFNGNYSWYKVTGVRSPSSFPGIETDEVELFFGLMGPVPGPPPAADTPNPLPGSPWEFGGGFSTFWMRGTNGEMGSSEVMYTVQKSAGRYDDPVPAAACIDELDNDGDLLTDFPTDPGCRHAFFPTENPECEDGVDNDGDSLKDMDDPQCVARSDRSEEVNCSDGVDNDADGDVDTDDPGCSSANSPLEEPQCSDGIDNDSDGRLDWIFGSPNGDLDCSGASDSRERAGCGLGVELALLLTAIWGVRQRPPGNWAKSSSRLSVS